MSVIGGAIAEPFIERPRDRLKSRMDEGTIAQLDQAGVELPKMASDIINTEQGPIPVDMEGNPLDWERMSATKYLINQLGNVMGGVVAPVKGVALRSGPILRGAKDLKGAKYVASQEGPYYRVTHEANPRFGSVSEGLRQEVGGTEAADAARGGRDAYTPPQLPSYEDIADILSNVETNISHQAAAKHSGREITRPEMPESSLQKQSAIGRAFALGTEDSPVYKRAIFNAYKKQMPEIVEMSGAKNYDELLAVYYHQLMKETADLFLAMIVHLLKKDGRAAVKLIGWVSI